MVIVGPCSIHDPEAACEYAAKLKPVADALRDRFLIVMRTYFEKPRTTVGWKGLINDPHLDGTCDIGTGMELARAILLRINQLGLPCGTELLDPISPQYVADLISWAAIGARTTESQTHREMASGPDSMNLPADMNGTVDVAFTIFVVHEVPDPGKLFREIADLQAPGGLLYYTEPRLIVSGREFRDNLTQAEAAGFSVVEKSLFFVYRAAVLRKKT